MRRTGTARIGARSMRPRGKFLSWIRNRIECSIWKGRRIRRGGQRQREAGILLELVGRGGPLGLDSLALAIHNPDRLVSIWSGCGGCAEFVEHTSREWLSCCCYCCRLCCRARPERVERVLYLLGDAGAAAECSAHVDRHPLARSASSSCAHAILLQTISSMYNIELHTFLHVYMFPINCTFTHITNLICNWSLLPSIIGMAPRLVNQVWSHSLQMSVSCLSRVLNRVLAFEWAIQIQLVNLQRYKQGA